jgi:hypothetical protein
MKFGAGVFLAASILFGAAIPMRATTIVSYSYSNWASSATNTHDADFTHIQFTSYGPAGYTTTDGFNITGPDGSGTSLQGLLFNGYSSLEGGNDSSAQVQVNAPSGGETALLFLLGSNPQGSNYTITLSDGESWTVAGSTTFFGVSVSHPITSAILSDSTGSNLVLEDVSYGATTLTLDSSDDSGGGSDPGAVPEATTMLLLGSGLILIAFSRKHISSL